MEIKIFKDSVELGTAAAKAAAKAINDAILARGSARIMLSTGMSQVDTVSSLAEQDIDWGKVEMFHLDEYIGLPEVHPASFRKYLKERFTSKLKTPLKAAYFVDGEGDIEAHIKFLNEKISESQIDLGLIGIGENAHIAFNDPPADFETEIPFIIVALDDKCKAQQVGEGWFADIDAVPKRAISASVKQIMECKKIISCVPFKVKAQAVRSVVKGEVSNLAPASIIQTHPDAALYLDEDSASYL